MIRLGILDFDTSHVVEFVRRLNHKGIGEEQWVDGAEVVVGCPGESRIMPERIPNYVKEVERLGVPLVDKPTDMIGKVDGMLIESQEGGVHWERARPFLEAGLPCYIDKPFTCSVADAKRIVELADKKKVPVFSSSSLRYVPELTAFVADEKMSIPVFSASTVGMTGSPIGQGPLLASSALIPKRIERHGKIHGALAYGPAHLFEKDPKLNPGFYHYGIHAVEILYTLMGPGCERVTCTHEKGADVVTGQWKDGRLATMRGIRSGKEDYGCVAFCDKGVYPLALNTKFIYRELLKRIVSLFTEKKPPLDVAVTVEIVAFIEAANKSAANHGTGEKVMA